ncbi:hypothetical protein DYH55_20785 [Methylovirgula sp. 4M-Z18]|nr:hypothetical protein DYH55_20785 [Methylovirgula sp. 4M-Z18]
MNLDIRSLADLCVLAAGKLFPSKSLHGLGELSFAIYMIHDLMIDFLSNLTRRLAFVGMLQQLAMWGRSWPSQAWCFAFCNLPIG